MGAPLFLLLAAAAFADEPNRAPPEAARRAKEIEACAKENPFEGKPFAGGLEGVSGAADRAVNWFAACMAQQDPCAALSDPEKDKVPRCRFCSAEPQTGCGVDQSCAPPPLSCEAVAPVYLNEPPKSAAPAKARPKMMQTSAGCIVRFLKENSNSEDKEPGPQACRASNAAIYERNKSQASDKCAPDALRDADHYFFTYCGHYQDWQFNQFPMTWCGLSYGYSGAKKLLGGFRSVLNAGSKNASEPTWEEAYWGCKGIRDSQDKSFPLSRE